MTASMKCFSEECFVLCVEGRAGGGAGGGAKGSGAESHLSERLSLSQHSDGQIAVARQLSLPCAAVAHIQVT